MAISVSVARLCVKEVQGRSERVGIEMNGQLSYIRYPRCSATMSSHTPHLPCLPTLTASLSWNRPPMQHSSYADAEISTGYLAVHRTRRSNTCRL